MTLAQKTVKWIFMPVKIIGILIFAILLLKILYISIYLIWPILLGFWLMIGGFITGNLDAVIVSAFSFVGAIAIMCFFLTGITFIISSFIVNKKPLLSWREAIIGIALMTSGFLVLAALVYYVNQGTSMYIDIFGDITEMTIELFTKDLGVLNYIGLVILLIGSAIQKPLDLLTEK